jgi:Leucine rich repeat
MNYIGIIALLIVVAAGAWWGGMNFSNIPQPESQETSYEEAIDSAKEVSTQVSEKAKEVAKSIPTSATPVVIYDGVTVDSNTLVVNLSGKGYTGSLKGEVRHLTELRELNLSNNKFTGVPAEIGQLSNLEVLNLSNNPVTGLPYELANLKSLKVLDLRGTNYAKADLEVIKRGLPATQVLVD